MAPVKVIFRDRRKPLRRSGSEKTPSRHASPYLFGRPGIAGRFGEVRAIAREDGVDLVGNGPRKSPEEVAGGAAGGFLMQLDEGELGVLSMATRRYNLPSPVRTSAMSM
jgi:hypothetical protein